MVDKFKRNGEQISIHREYLIIYLWTLLDQIKWQLGPSNLKWEKSITEILIGTKRIKYVT